MIHISSFTLPRARLRLLFFFVGVLGLVLLPAPPVFAAVVINEIFPKPNNETSEWIELYNNGPDPVSLEGWRLENTAGDKKTYIIGSSTILQVHSFWTFDQAQTTISLYNDGDTVRLIDAQNTTLDSESYSGTLGVYNSVGRSSDGGGVWTICASWSKNLPNNCPPPPTLTPTLIPPPTGRPTDTPIPIVLPSSTPILPIVTPDLAFTPIPIATFVAARNQSSSHVLGAAADPTPPANEKGVSFPDLKKFILRWTLGVVSLCIGIGAILILIIGLLYKYKHRHE